jgi:hypothetical protein
MRNFFFILSIVLLLISDKTLKAQTLVVTFEYDAAGNRIKRSMQASPPPNTNWNDRHSGPIDSTLSKQNLEQEGNFKINAYPNPTDKDVIVTIDGFDYGKNNANLTLIDIQGKIIQKMKISNKSTSLDLSDYPSGTYYLLISVDAEKSSYKIIKR